MAAKIMLSATQIHSLVSENKYPVSEEVKFTSRCIDGRYKNEKNLPALAIAGADIGDLAALYATARQYAFTVDPEKAFKTLQELVGVDNFSWHTDEHGGRHLLGSGCGHLKQIRLDPEAFSLQKEDVATIDKQLEIAKSEGGKETVLEGDHHEGAVLLLKGSYGVLPQYNFDSDQGKVHTQVFIFHQTLVNARHRAWCKLLIENGAVTLFDNLDEEYLYEVLSNTTEDHFFEIAKRLAKDLPIYSVVFDEKGSFEIEQQGFV